MHLTVRAILAAVLAASSAFNGTLVHCGTGQRVHLAGGHSATSKCTCGAHHDHEDDHQHICAAHTEEDGSAKISQACSGTPVDSIELESAPRLSIYSGAAHLWIETPLTLIDLVLSLAHPAPLSFDNTDPPPLHLRQHVRTIVILC